MLRRSGISSLSLIPLTALMSKNHTENQTEDGPNKPRFVHATVLFRHGARTPVFTDLPGLEEMDWNICTKKANEKLPKVEVRDLGNGGARPPLTGSVRRQGQVILKGNGGICHAGQLSDLGIEQTTDLGRKLREMYGSYIGDDVSNVTVRTTNVPRCVTSAQGVMTGLFPRNEETLPFYTLFMKNEYATPRTNTCPRLADLWKAAGISWARAPESDAARVLAEVGKVLTKEEMHAFKLHQGNVIPLRDMLVALEAHGLKQPYPQLVPLIDRIDRLGGLQLGALLKGGGGWANELESSRLASGKLLAEVIDRLNDHALHPGPPTLYLVSAHDTTLVPMLTALGNYDGNWPPFASYMSFELWEENDPNNDKEVIHSVRVLYNDRPLPLPRCHANAEGRIPLQDVRWGLKPLFPKNWELECATNKVESKKPKGDGDKFE